MPRKHFEAAMAIFAMLLVACDKTNREEEVPVASISLRPTYAELILGESLSLTAKVEPENATDKKIVWESSTPAVVSVTQNGVVTAESLGEVTITARAGGKAATSMIKVIQRVVPVTSLTLDHASLEMIEGDESVYWLTDIGREYANNGVKFSTFERDFELYIDATGSLKESAQKRHAPAPVTYCPAAPILKRPVW